jgi:hypothetical protein
MPNITESRKIEVLQANLMDLKAAYDDMISTGQDFSTVKKIQLEIRQLEAFLRELLSN